MIERLAALVASVLAFVFHRRLEKYLAWVEYEVGSSGVGTTPMDKMPSFPKPWLPKRVRRGIQREYVPLLRKERQAKWNPELEDDDASPAG